MSRYSKNLITLFGLLLLTTTVAAQGQKSQTQAQSYVTATPCYDIQIFEAGDNLLRFDDPQHLRTAGAASSRRGFLGSLFKNMRSEYQSTLTGQIVTTSGDVLSSGIGLLADLFRSKRSDWAKQVRQECQFVKKISMGREIHDFYGTTTTRGALDPDGMLFTGFGCTQYYVTGTDTITSLYLRCNLRTDEQGKNRILHHGKFEVEVAQLYVNPYLCGLPNDSLSAPEAQLRVPFDFKRRKNLKFQITADLFSSWMSQALQINNDQQLGQFVVTLTLPDSTSIETEGDFKGWYVYDATQGDKDSKKPRPQVVGECFIVPRSYIGTDDGETFADVWGTGQYKIDLTLSVACDINEDFYLEKDEEEMAAQPRDPAQGNAHPAMPGQQTKRHWNRYWSEEWNMMKKRKKSNKSFFKAIADNVAVNYKDGRWVYTVLEPVANYVLSAESARVNKVANTLFGLDATDTAATSAMPAATNAASGTTSTPAATATPAGAASSAGTGTPGGTMPQKP